MFGKWCPVSLISSAASFSTKPQWVIWHSSEIDLHHHIAEPFYATYSMGAAWLESNLRVSNCEQFLTTAEVVSAYSGGCQWKGYWPRTA